MIRIVEKKLNENNKDIFLWALDNHNRRVKDIYCTPFHKGGGVLCSAFRLEKGVIEYNREFFIINDKQGRNWVNIIEKDIISANIKERHVDIFLQKGVLSFDLL